MSTLFLPDLQYHFRGMDPNWVVNHAYNLASYILANDNPIEDGETVDGVENSQISRKIQWKCQYEEALKMCIRDSRTAKCSMIDPLFAPESRHPRQDEHISLMDGYSVR